MSKDIAAANVDRAYSLATTNIGIFTFVLFFLYPKHAAGEINALLFQTMLTVMGLATFSFAFATFYYYSASLGDRIDRTEQARYGRGGDRCWLLGCVLLFFVPGLVLISIRLHVVAFAWLALWLVYIVFVIRYFPRVQTARGARENR